VKGNWQKAACKLLVKLNTDLMSPDMLSPDVMSPDLMSPDSLASRPQSPIENKKYVATSGFVFPLSPLE